MSGGRATVQNRKGGGNETQLGDLTCVHPKGLWLTKYFIVECKFYKDLKIDSAVLFGRGPLATFWQQLCTLSRKHEGKSPMLIAKQNQLPTLVILDQLGARRFQGFGHTLNPVLETSVMQRKRITLVCIYDQVFLR